MERTACFLWLGIAPLVAVLHVQAGFTGCTPPGQWGPANITTVHIIFSNHLDVGFDGIDPEIGFAFNVINKYFDVYFPAAVATAQALRQSTNTTARLVFTTHAWLIDLYLNCLPVLYKPIHCPNASSLNAFTAAIERGDVTWHAFPFNAEPEVYDEAMFEYGAILAHQLDKRFGKPSTRTMSQRDVPGATRSIIPALLRQGVQALSVGVNGGSAPPAVDTAFRWQMPADRHSNATQELIVMYHKGGYGGITVADAIIVPGLSHALIPAWDGDNAGPPSFEKVVQTFATVQKEFPNAVVKASTFDGFLDALLPFRACLPVVSDEIGDTWIKGVSSDPKKLQIMKAIFSARTACLDRGDCSTDSSKDPSFYNFSRLLLKTGEHTWGADMKKTLKDWTNWSNTKFNAALSGQNYRNMIESWQEQRWYIDAAVGALNASSSLAQDIRQRLAAIETLAQPPSTQGYTKVSGYSGGVLQAGLTEVAFSVQTGAIVHLRDSSKHTWADQNHPLALVQYETFDNASYATYYSQYLYCLQYKVACAALHALDFGKPGVSLANPLAATATPKFVALYQRISPDSHSFRVQLAMPSAWNTQYGAPAELWLTVNINPNTDHTLGGYDSVAMDLNVTLNLVNKTATRLPEAMWLSFQPVSQANGAWEFVKLGYPVDPTRVVVNGSRSLHAVESVSYLAADRQLTVVPWDSPVVAPGVRSLLNFSNALPDLNSDGFHVNLFNNLWGTNYVLWYPFDGDDNNFASSFVVRSVVCPVGTSGLAS